MAFDDNDFKRKMVTVEELISVRPENLWTIDEFIFATKQFPKHRPKKDHRQAWPHLTLSVGEVLTMFNKIYEIIECRFAYDKIYRFMNEACIEKIVKLQKERIEEDRKKRAKSGKDVNLVSSTSRPKPTSVRIYRQDEYRCFASVVFKQKNKEIFYLITLDQEIQRWIITDFIEVSD